MRKVVPSKSEVTLGDPLGRAEEWYEDGPLSFSYFIRCNKIGATKLMAMTKTFWVSHLSIGFKKQ